MSDLFYFLFFCGQGLAEITAMVNDGKLEGNPDAMFQLNKASNSNC
jgi:hypothetical protein